MSLVYSVRYAGMTLEETRAAIEIRYHRARADSPEHLFEALADIGEFNRAYPDRRITPSNPLRVTVVGAFPAFPR